MTDAFTASVVRRVLDQMEANLRAESIYRSDLNAPPLTRRQRVRLAIWRARWYLAHVRDAVLARDCDSTDVYDYDA